MEDILELIVSVLFMPFESKYDNLLGRINHITIPVVRILLKVFVILIPLAFIIGLYCLLNYAFRGYWI